MTWKRAIATLHQLRTKKGRRTLGQFAAEGYRLLERALESQVGLREVVVAETLMAQPTARAANLLQQLQKQACPVCVAPDEEVHIFTEGRTFGDMLGIIDALPQADLSPFLTDKSQPCTLLVLVQVMDPGNIGALARTAMASGVDALIALGGTDLFQAKAVRTSMGALFDLPVCQLDEGWDEWVGMLHQADITTIGAVVGNGEPPFQTQASDRRALLMGSEAHGIPLALQEQLRLRWTIPMPETIDSFSVNAATSVLLYELNRQSWTK